MFSYPKSLAGSVAVGEWARAYSLNAGFTFLPALPSRSCTLFCSRFIPLLRLLRQVIGCLVSSIALLGRHDESVQRNPRRVKPLSLLARKVFHGD